MPPVPGIPNVVQFLVKMTWDTGHNTVNSFHFRSGNPGPYSIGDLTLVASEVQSQWAAEIMGHLSASITQEEVVVIDRSVSDGNKAVNVTTAAGTFAHEPLPLNTAGLYQWQDSAHYRGGHPRTYIPGFVIDYTTDGVHLEAGSQATLNTAMNNFLTNVLAGGPYGAITPLTWVACHYQRNKLPLVTPFASIITPEGFSGTLATQRRRLRKAAHS